jgi:predicted RNase H-like HicB family nuclease
MAKDLTYYRLLPYEREWLMREDAGQKYFVVRLRDYPAVAGDGLTRDEAAEDLRVAFDEFVSAWLEAGRPIPEPKRAFTIPSAPHEHPVVAWHSSASIGRTGEETPSSWTDRAVVYTTDVRVTKPLKRKPSLAVAVGVLHHS